MAALKIFCDVVRYRSFSEAAQMRGYTQSAVSQIVSQLEKRMEVQLLDRSTRPLQLTPLGQSYYESCKTLVEQYDELAERYEQLEAGIRNAQVEISGTVTVTAIYSVGLNDMGHSVQRFMEEFPKAEVHIDYLHPDRVYERVQNGSADLGLVSFPKKAADLVAVPWREEEMVLACSPKHPLARQLALPMCELDGQPYVHFDKNLIVRRRVDRFLREQRVAVEVVAEFDSIENIKQAVSINAGVALLPEPTIHREVQARTLAAVPLFGCRFIRPLAIVHRRKHRLGAAAKRFMELLLEPDGSRSSPEGGTEKILGDAHEGPNAQEASRGKNGSPRISTKRMTGS